MKTEPMMQTAVTAFRNGQILETFMSPDDVETYRSVHMQHHDVGCSPGMKMAGESCPAIGMAIEDAEFDLGTGVQS